MYLAYSKGGANRQYTYVRLVETYRTEKGTQRQRTIQNFGRLDRMLANDPLALEKIKAQLADDKAAKFNAESKLLLEGLYSFLAKVSGGTRKKLVFCTLLYGHYVLKRIWDELELDKKISNLQYYGLNIDYVLKDVIFYMVAMKALFPKSIYSSWNFRTQFLGDPVGLSTLRDFYDSYDRLYEIKDRLTQWINRKVDHEFGKDRMAVVYYDLTNTYFEAPLTDAERGLQRKDFESEVLELAQKCADENLFPQDCFDADGQLVIENLPDFFWDLVDAQKIEFLRMRGPSKEHRRDLPLISVALIIDRYGIPVDVKVYAGNASEFKTMKQSIEALVKKYGVSKTVVVADRGLNSKANLRMLLDLGFGFLMAQKVTNLNAELTKQLLDLDSYLPIDPDNPEYGKYKEIKNWKRTIGKGIEPVVCNLVFTWNNNRKIRDDRILDNWVEIVKKKAKSKTKLGKRKSGWASIAQTDQPTEGIVIGVDEAALAEKRKFCGFAAVVYDADDGKFADIVGLPQEAKNFKPCAVQAATAYHVLVQIEDCFRCMKSFFGLRPVRVWNSKRVESHVYICFLALLIIRLLQKKMKKAGITDISLEETLQTLRDAKVIVTPPDSSRNVSFLSVSLDAIPAGTSPWLSRAEVVKLIEEEDESAETNLTRIMNAVGLKEPSAVSQISHLEESLKTNFYGLEGAVPMEWLKRMEKSCTF